MTIFAGPTITKTKWVAPYVTGKSISTPAIPHILYINVTNKYNAIWVTTRTYKIQGLHKRSNYHDKMTPVTMPMSGHVSIA